MRLQNFFQEEPLRDEDWNDSDGTVSGKNMESPADWPRGVTPMTWQGMGRLGFGEDNRLYWDGKPILVEKRIRLENYQIVLASVATAGAILSGLHPFGHSFGWW